MYSFFIKEKNKYVILVPPMGLEPTIFRLEVERVIQLRHEGTKI